VIAIETTTLKKDFEATLTLAKKLKPLRDGRDQMRREMFLTLTPENVSKMILKDEDPVAVRKKFDAKITEMNKEIDTIVATVRERFSVWSSETAEWARHASEKIVYSRRFELKQLLEKAASIIVEQENAATVFAKRHEELKLARTRLLVETEDHGDALPIPQLNSLAVFPKVERTEYESGHSSRVLLSISSKIR
jgi:hypothetical protein